jgi:hypothetical protein
MTDTGIVLPDADPRDREIQAAVLALVEAYAFREARDILSLRLREVDGHRRSHVEALFLEWRRLDPAHRPDFLSFAHHRRNPEIAHGG